jgi:peptide/nickel transport system substrate-binding protein
VEYATCEKLYDYPDAEGSAGTRLVAEAAEGPPRVSADGRTYVFQVRRGILSNLGHELTAANFAAAISRVGGLDPYTKLGFRVLAARASGQTLTVRLARPTVNLPALLSIPYFCAIPTNLPRGIVDQPIESWGPYYVVERVLEESTALAVNPNYRGPRPHLPSRIVFTVRRGPLQAILDDLDRGDADYALASFDSDTYAALAAKKELVVRPTMTLRYLALNEENGIFSGNPKLRQAVNYALDRPALVRAQGFDAARRATHYLPPGMPGYVANEAYPRRGADLATARKLAKGHTRDGVVTITNCNRLCAGILPVLRYDLAQIGLRVQTRLTRGQFQGPLPYDDINVEGWTPDFADPYATLNVLLDPRSPYDAAFNLNAPYLSELRQAPRLTGPARLAAYGKLDLEIARTDAPLAAISYDNDRIVVSSRVRSFVYQPLYGLDLGSVELAPG